MDLEFFSAKNGFLTAKSGSALIHSAYDPIKEAQRFLESKVQNTPSTVILIGSGLRYLDESVLQKYPGISVLSLHVDNTCYHMRELDRISLNQYHYWSSESLSTLDQFLSENLKEISLEGLEILSWGPMVQADERYDAILRTVKSFIQRLESSFYSLAQFGWRWINNIIANYIDTDETLLLPNVDDIVIAASGPSLEQALPSLKKYRTNYYLMALPSSLNCLSAHGIIPDLTVMTDGGYYAKKHLEFLDKHQPVAMPLVASYNHDHPKMLFGFGTFFEHFLLEKTVIPQFSWNGTVAGNAILLAQAMAKGKIVLVGQDFSSKDVHLHAFPHTFSRIYEVESSRCLPLLFHYHKAVWESQSSLEIYATWFQSQTFAANIYRMLPSEITLPFQEFKLTELKNLHSGVTQSQNPHTIALPEKKQRYQKVLDLISFLKLFIKNLENLSVQEEDILLYLDALKYYQYKKSKRLGLEEDVKKHELLNQLTYKLDALSAKYQFASD